MIRFIISSRERNKDLLSNEEYISMIVCIGKEKAQENAFKKIREVHKIVGLKRF